MHLDLLDTFERATYNQLLKWYKEKQSPLIAKELFLILRDRGYSHSIRTFKGKILSSLRRQGLIEGKMVKNGKHKGVMGYVPTIKELSDSKIEESKKIDTWKIEFLAEILRDDSASEVMKETASHRLMDSCGHDTLINIEGKEFLRDFFSDFLMKPNYTDKNRTNFSIFSALESFIAFHMSDELNGVIDNYYGQLLCLFREHKGKELRHKVLRCLGRLFYVCQENNDTTRTTELNDLFLETFFDPSENSTIVSDAFENMRIWNSKETTQKFVDKLYKNSKSDNEVIKARCLKYLEEKILPLI